MPRGYRKVRIFYPERIEDARQRILAAYARQGDHRANVRSDLLQTDEGLELTLEVQEGSPTPIKAIHFAGSPGLPLPRLLEALRLRPEDPLDRNSLEGGLERIKLLYQHQRHYRARVGEPVVTAEKGGAIVLLPVSAGPQYSFRFYGNRSFSDRLLEAVAHYDGAEILDSAVVGRLARRIVQFYRYRGFHDARVEPREILSPKQSLSVLAFDVEEGSPVVWDALRRQSRGQHPGASRAAHQVSQPGCPMSRWWPGPWKIRWI